MDTVHSSILRSLKEVLAEVLPQGGEAYLFGSRARGDAHPDSDWDVLIILDKNKIEADDYDQVSYPLVELGWKFSQCVSPVLYTRSDWQKCRVSPFYQNVNREAVLLV